MAVRWSCHRIGRNCLLWNCVNARGTLLSIVPVWGAAVRAGRPGLGLPACHTCCLRFYHDVLWTSSDGRLGCSMSRFTTRALRPANATAS